MEKQLKHQRRLGLSLTMTFAAHTHLAGTKMKMQVILLHTKVKHKIVNIILSIIFNICFVYSKELSHRDISFDNPQYNYVIRKYLLIMHALRL